MANNDIDNVDLGYQSSKSVSPKSAKVRPETTCEPLAMETSLSPIDRNQVDGERLPYDLLSILLPHN